MYTFLIIIFQHYSVSQRLKIQSSPLVYYKNNFQFLYKNYLIFLQKSYYQKRLLYISLLFFDIVFCYVVFYFLGIFRRYNFKIQYFRILIFNITQFFSPWQCQHLFFLWFIGIQDFRHCIRPIRVWRQFTHTFLFFIRTCKIFSH